MKKKTPKFWSQDPYNWYVVVVLVVVLGTHSKILLENNLTCQNWKFSKLKVAKIESCQNLSYQNWKMPKLLKLKIAKLLNLVLTCRISTREGEKYPIYRYIWNVTAK